RSTDVLPGVPDQESDHTPEPAGSGRQRADSRDGSESPALSTVVKFSPRAPIHGIDAVAMMQHPTMVVNRRRSDRSNDFGLDRRRVVGILAFRERVDHVWMVAPLATDLDSRQLLLLKPFRQRQRRDPADACGLGLGQELSHACWFQHGFPSYLSSI